MPKAPLPPPPPLYSCICSVVVPKQNRLRSYELLVLFQVSASETVFTEGYSVSILVIKVILTLFFKRGKTLVSKIATGFVQFSDWQRLVKSTEIQLVSQ